MLWCSSYAWSKGLATMLIILLSATSLDGNFLSACSDIYICYLQGQFVGEAMSVIAANTDVPVSVKCRIGVDDHDSYSELCKVLLWTFFFLFKLKVTYLSWKFAWNFLFFFYKFTRNNWTRAKVCAFMLSSKKSSPTFACLKGAFECHANNHAFSYVEPFSYCSVGLLAQNLLIIVAWVHLTVMWIDWHSVMWNLIMHHYCKYANKILPFIDFLLLDIFMFLCLSISDSHVIFMLCYIFYVFCFSIFFVLLICWC